jgi:16S rRNA (cytosine967-C5)-methyltransferase
LSALRVGLYQLLFLDRVPAYAAVDASVRLVERSGRGVRAFVNAVLRRASAAGRSGLALPPSSDPVGRMAVEWSHPRWLVERWADESGIESLPAMLEANNRAAPTTLRVNPRQTTRDALLAELAEEGIDARAGRFAPGAVDVSGGAGRLRALAAHREGRFAFQGEASQLVAALVDVTPGARLIDACAAPGGKSLAVAERMSGSGRVVALDPNRRGLARLAGEARRLGIAEVLVGCGDARRPPLAGRIDAILVDAPCSGLGTLRQHPELRWRRTPEDVPRLAALQGEILAGMAPLVAPGGVLVYAVCTGTPEETTRVVASFTVAHPRFVVEPLSLPCVGDDGLLRTSPHEHGLDGFFAARLRAAT